jgi:hypothetical protein
MAKTGPMTDFLHTAATTVLILLLYVQQWMMHSYVSDGIEY